MIDIRAAESGDLRAMYRLYTNATAPLVHGFAVGAEEFIDAFRGGPRYLRDHTVLVSASSQHPWELTGFARVGIFKPISERWSFASAGNGMVFGPFVCPAEGGADGDALLEAAISWLSVRGAGRCFAFDPVESASLPFYNGGWCGLSERMPGLLAIYARAGFRIEHRELCMARPDLAVQTPAEPPGRIALVDEVNPERRSAVRLWDRGALVGSCFYSRMYPRRSDRTQAERTGYIDSLTVAERYQGRGFGRLLLQTALLRLRKLGCRDVCLTTSAANLRAQNLYYSLNFALTDSCVTLSTGVKARELIRFG